MVVKGVKRIWHRICYFIRAKKIWSKPRQSDVLIYDADGQEILLEYLNSWHPEVLHLRGEEINVQVLISFLFRRLARPSTYIDCFMEKVRPRLVVTLIDNNSNFYTISQKHPGVKTLFIQNGLRGNHLDVFEGIDKVDCSKFFVDYKLVFGSAIGEKYAQYIKGNTVLMGSIRNNFIIKEILPEQGVIAFVSQWRSEGDCVGGVFFSTEILSLQFISLVVQRLMRYAVEKNKRLMIIPRYPKHSDLRAAEESYFRELLGCEPVYLGPEGLCSGYMAVDSADVVVAIDSTLGYESIARGNKTAIFSIRSSSSTTPGMLRYGWPGDFLDEGPFWTNNPDPDKLVRILDYLFEVNDIQWREDVRASNFSSLMVYDPGNTTLKSTLEEVLGPPPL